VVSKSNHDRRGLLLGRKLVNRLVRSAFDIH
jgi:hypothetical protein